MSEKKSISLLDEGLINKIAAGEVIEDSASVIKELLENALDAGATLIEVTTKLAGRSLIKIADNGHGIAPEQLPLAFYRHATSKICKIEDLFSLETFGFRGEALASISSVSLCTLISAVEGQMGHKIHSEGGQMISSVVAPRQRGTTVEIRDLFFNVPVRKKFQKTASSALRDIHKVLTQVAFACPQVNLKWINDGHMEFHLHAGRDLLDTVVELLGKEYQGNFFMCEESVDLWEIKGCLSVPFFSKINRSGQFLFVNGRPIVSTLISDAVYEAYGTRISVGRYPHFILFLKMPSHLLDVNVHPQKKEVRFSQHKELYSFVRDSVRKALEKRSAPISFLPSLEEHPLPLSLSYTPLVVSAPERFSVKKESPILFSVLAIVGQIILIHKEGHYYLADAWAAQKRILYENSEQSSSAEGQTLLFPVTLELKGSRFKAYERNIALFQKLKIDIRPIGKDSYIIDALPQEMDVDKICDLLDKIDGEKEEKRIAFCLNMLVKKKRITIHEGHKLLEMLFRCKVFTLCPEGRPIIIDWPKEHIEKLFL